MVRRHGEDLGCGRLDGGDTRRSVLREIGAGGQDIDVRRADQRLDVAGVERERAFEKAGARAMFSRVSPFCREVEPSKLSFRCRLRPGARQDRDRVHGSRRNGIEEHSPAGAGLCDRAQRKRQAAKASGVRFVARRAGVDQHGSRAAPFHRRPALCQYRRRPRAGIFRRRRHRDPDHGFVAHRRLLRDRPRTRPSPTRANRST